MADIAQILQSAREAKRPQLAASLAGRQQRLAEEQTQRKAAERDVSLPESLALGILSPLTSFGKTAGESARLGEAQRAGRDISEFQPGFLEGDEFEEFKADPTGSLVKRGIGASSFLVPGAGAFGGGIRGLAAAGTAAGGLAGFGASKAGQEIEGALGGGLVGGAVGGGLGLLGKGVSKLRGGAEEATQVGLRSSNKFNRQLEDITQNLTGKKRSSALQKLVNEVPADEPLRDSILKVASFEDIVPTGTRPQIFRAKRLDLDPKRLNLSPKELDKAGGKFIRSLDDAKLPTGTKAQLANSADELIGTLGGRADEILTNSGKTINVPSISAKIRKVFKNNPKLTQTTAAQEVLGNLADLGDEVSVSALNKFRQGLDDLLGDKAFVASANLTDRARFVKAVRQTIASDVKAQVGNTQFSKIMDEMSNAFTLRPEILRAASKGTRANLGALQIPAPVIGPALERAQDVAGRVVGGSVPGVGALGRAAEGISNIPGLPQAASAIGRVAPIVGAQQAVAPQAPTQPLPDATTQPLEGVEGAEALLAGQPSTQARAGARRAPSSQEILLGALSAGFDVNEAVSLSKALSPETEEENLSVTEKKLRNQSTQGLQAIDDIEELLSGDTTGVLLAATLPGFAQTGEARQFNNAVDMAAEMFGRIQSGGAINQDEEARFRRFLPQNFDDQETINVKLQSMRDALQGVA